jgi:hypothetical protein
LQASHHHGNCFGFRCDSHGQRGLGTTYAAAKIVRNEIPAILLLLIVFAAVFWVTFKKKINDPIHKNH